MEQNEEAVAELKHRVALSYQILYMEGVASDDTLGHVSARLPNGAGACVKPWGLGFDEVTPQALVEMDFDSNKIGGGDGRLHMEMPLHNEIYRARPDVNCVIHIHPLYATLLSSVWTGHILRLNQHTQQFAAGIGYYESSALITTPPQGKGVAEALGAHHALLLKNHGIITAAANIEQAVVLAVQLERAAQAHIIMSVHEDVKEIPLDVALHWANELFQMKHCGARFEYWVRKLSRVGQGLYGT